MNITENSLFDGFCNPWKKNEGLRDNTKFKLIPHSSKWKFEL